MRKNVCLTALLIFLPQLVLAETCPSVRAVQTNTAPGWHIYDSDTNKRLSAKHTLAFRKAAKEFALAEWAGSAKKNTTIHCYYRDDNGSNLEAYLAKSNFIPINSQDTWYQVSGFMQCAASAEQCSFQPLANNKYLAAK